VWSIGWTVGADCRLADGYAWAAKFLLTFVQNMHNLIPVMPKKNLRDHLELSGQTQAAFATRLGLSQSYVSRIVNGECVPGLRLALRIAAEAKVPVESLLSDRRSAA
jgi:DNA-binding XRE family transcriptional regulator